MGMMCVMGVAWTLAESGVGVGVDVVCNGLCGYVMGVIFDDDGDRCGVF